VNEGYGYEAEEGKEEDEGYGKDWTMDNTVRKKVSARLHNDKILKD